MFVIYFLYSSRSADVPSLSTAWLIDIFAVLSSSSLFPYRPDEVAALIKLADHLFATCLKSAMLKECPKLSFNVATIRSGLKMSSSSTSALFGRPSAGICLISL